MTSLALYVELKAKPGREEDVATFLAKARDMVAAETGPLRGLPCASTKPTLRFSTRSMMKRAGRRILRAP